jgi:RNA polymerase sigma factor (sigma-70 family)
VLRGLRQVVGEAADNSDRQLLERFVATRDESAFAALVERHGRLALGVCRSVLHHEQDAEDAFQATFLVLARMAGSIRKRESLSSWLHGVALRTSLKARKAMATRRRREQQAEPAEAVQPAVSGAALQEVQAILHEEVGRLAEKYRAPFVLCCLEGKSRAEAAQQLGWKEGTVSGRIAMAREVLQRRLTQRGVALPAALCAAAVAPAAAPAAAIVARCAVTFAGRNREALPTQAAALAEGVIRAMSLSKVKLGLGMILAAVLVLSAGGLVAYPALHPATQQAQVDRQEPPAGGTDEPKKPQQQPDKGKAPPAPEAEVPNKNEPAPPPPAQKIRNPFAEGGLGEPYKIFGDKRFAFPLNGLAFSRDGKLVAGASIGFNTMSTMEIVDVAAGKTLLQASDHTPCFKKLLFAPDAKTIYSAGNPQPGGSWLADSHVYAWDVASGKQLKQLPAQHWDLSPDGKLLATVDSQPIDIDPGFGAKDDKGDIKRIQPNFTLHLWNTTTWKEVATLADKANSLSAIRFTPDGKRVALAGADFVIRFWDWQARKETGRIQVPKEKEVQYPEALTMLAFSPDGGMLATACDSVILNGVPRKIVLWDVAKATKLKTLTGPEFPVEGLAFTPKGDQIVANFTQGSFQVFDVASGDRLKPADNTWGNPAIALAFFRQGLNPEPGAVTPKLLTDLWDLATGEDISSGKVPDRLWSLAISPDDRIVAGGDARGVIRLWNVATGDEVGRITDKEKSGVLFLSYVTVPTGAEKPKVFLASQHWDGHIYFWNPETGKVVYSLPGAGGLLRSMAVCADGKIATCIHSGDSVMLWNGLDDKKPRRVTLPCWGPTIQFTPDGKELLCGGWDGPVRVLDFASGKVVRTVGQGNVKDFALSPDGRTLATFGFSGKAGESTVQQFVRLWDVGSGEEIGEIAGAPQAQYKMLWSFDGRGLLVQHGDGQGIWELASGQMRFYAPGFWKATFSSKSRMVVNQMQGTIRVWDLTGRNKGGVLDPAPLKAEELAKLWTDLQAGAAEAYAAIWRLAGVPEQSVPFLEEKLRTVPPQDPKLVAKLIAELDSDKFTVRENAMKELPRHGRKAMQAVKDALAANPPLEVRLRLEALQPKLSNYCTTPEETLAPRVIEILEQCATPAARRLVEALANGDKPQFTGPAREALGRMKKD